MTVENIAPKDVPKHIAADDACILLPAKEESDEFVVLIEPLNFSDGKNCSHRIQSVANNHRHCNGIDAGKVERAIGLKPAGTVETGIHKSELCYPANQARVANVQSGACREWVEKNYTGRVA